MNSDNEEVEINLKEILFLLKKKIFIILISTFVLAVAALIYTNIFVSPVYSSTSKIFILTKSTSITTFADIQLGTSLTKDYMQLIKSRPVVEKVIDNLKLSNTYESMIAKLSVENPADTRILNITIKDQNPKIAKEIADEFAVVASERISHIMETDEPNIIEEGYASNVPIGPSAKKNTVIAGMVGAVMSIGILLGLYIMDDTIKTSEDIEKYLGLNTLAEIPLAKGDKRPKRGKKKLVSRMEVGS